MNIATMTYHWMPNYGAVLQTYALQQFLKENKHETEVLNYVPKRILYRSYLGYIKRKQFDILKRISQTKKFIKNEIKVSNQEYHNHFELEQSITYYNAFICGSDQIWCEWFIKNAEKKDCFSYYLDFVGDKSKKIAYAVSFGSVSISNDSVKNIMRYGQEFDWIGVREKEGQQLLKKIGIKSKLVCDPVFLISREKFNELADKCTIKEQKAFVFILKNNKQLAVKLIKEVEKKDSYCTKTKSVYEWLAVIKKSSIVVTDSFHCMAFCLIFHTPFWVVPTGNHGFDDRIQTLLEIVNLGTRKCSYIRNDLENTDIDWSEVDDLLKKYTDKSRYYLNEVLNYDN